ncbi:hypothetical protein Y032_0827g2553 [Ancylostoma ceylanicum]|uniref:Uncharacterized protein n=1 Tax=Ancylostoma ceylanicum TaxID=53326 RepID=A0A016WBA8_9BILA|nr:hypothetical protein Y032_0827g2553 [Ancylostoma ceylanicum]
MWHPAPPSLATVGGASRRTPSPAAAEANIGDRRRQCWRWAIANFGDRWSLPSLATARPMRVDRGRRPPSPTSAATIAGDGDAVCNTPRGV